MNLAAWFSKEEKHFSCIYCLKTSPKTPRVPTKAFILCLVQTFSSRSEFRRVIIATLDTWARLSVCQQTDEPSRAGGHGVTVDSWVPKEMKTVGKFHFICWLICMFSPRNTKIKTFHQVCLDCVCFYSVLWDTLMPYDRNKWWWVGHSENPPLFWLTTCFLGGGLLLVFAPICTTCEFYWNNWVSP